MIDQIIPEYIIYYIVNILDDILSLPPKKKIKQKSCLSFKTLVHVGSLNSLPKSLTGLSITLTSDPYRFDLPGPAGGAGHPGHGDVVLRMD